MSNQVLKMVMAVLLAHALTACVTVPASPLEEGVSAYERSDYARALRILNPLAEQGIAPAQARLGLMYANGHGVPKDFAEAMKWFQKAADQGDANGQDNLAFMYFRGDALTQDYVQAYRWLSLAVRGANTDKERALRTRGIRALAAKMTSAQIVEAQKLASERCALAVCATVLTPVPGKSVASSELQRDIFQLILTLDVDGTNCNQRRITNMEIMVAPEPSNRFTAVEHWTLDRCGKLIPQRITLNPSPRGGTDFKVAPE
jgi:tetratricopeptide (TPR) repeat protein